MGTFQRVLWGTLEVIYRIYVGLAMSVFSRLNIGTNVYEQDWDVLVILDTARVDAVEQIAPKFEFIDEVESIWSVGSTSSEWIAKTFTDEYRKKVEETVLISSNPHVQRTLFEREFPEHDKNAYFAATDWDTVEPDVFEYIDQPWQYATDEKYDHVRPADLTDRAVALHRDLRPDRMIVHYMQPHRPHVARAIEESRELTEAERDPFSYLKNGGDSEVVFENHVADLEWVLETGVQPLLNNIDADTVAISADHGDGFGENWCYAHIAGDPRPQVRRVPWVETTATDRGDLDPTLEIPDAVDQRTEDRLKALGYV